MFPEVGHATARPIECKFPVAAAVGFSKHPLRIGDLLCGTIILRTPISFRFLQGGTLYSSVEFKGRVPRIDLATGTKLRP